jgi:hypothetical protein
MKVNGVEIAERWVNTYVASMDGGDPDSCPVCGTLIEELSEAEARIAKLAVKPKDAPVRCSYCGVEICKAKEWDSEVPKHMALCEKQPLAKLLKRNAELREENARLKAQLAAFRASAMEAKSKTLEENLESLVVQFGVGPEGAASFVKQFCAELAKEQK